MEGQDHRPRPPEAHQVRLPVAKGLPRCHRQRPLVDRGAVGDEAGGAAAPPSPPALFGLALGEAAGPPVVLDPGLLPVDEPVDALVAEHPAPRFPGQPLRDLLRRPPPGKPRQHAIPQGRVPFQPGPPPPPAVGRLLGVVGCVAPGGDAVAASAPEPPSMARDPELQQFAAATYLRLVGGQSETAHSQTRACTPCQHLTLVLHFVCEFSESRGAVEGRGAPHAPRFHNIVTPLLSGESRNLGAGPGGK